MTIFERCKAVVVGNVASGNEASFIPALLEASLSTEYTRAMKRIENMKPSLLTPSHPKSGKRLRCLIVLSGKGNVGKSGTLLSLGAELRDEALSYYELKGQARSRDRRIAARIRGRDIGIGTAGDTTAIAKANIDFFIEQNCLVGILAANTGGGTNVAAFIKTWAKSNGVACVDIPKQDLGNEFAREAFQKFFAKVMAGILLHNRSSMKIVHAVSSEKWMLI